VVAGCGVGVGAGVDGGGELFLVCGVSGVAEELTGGIGDADLECAAASLASARFTAATVSCWLGAGARP